MKKLTALAVALTIATTFVGVAVGAGLHKDESGRWVNEKGGNPYGDSRWRDADPKWNRSADPKWNPNSDSEFKKNDGRGYR